MQAPTRFSKASGGVISLFHDEQASLCVPLAASSHNADVPVCISSVHEPSRTAASSCAACVAIFSDYIEQRAHFKSDWHRYAYLRRFTAIHSSISSIRLPNIKNTFPFIFNKPSYFLLRRNLQRHIKGLAPLSEDQFDAAISASGHISASSSISGSDRDSDEISSVGSDENGAHSESSEVTRNLSHIVVRHPKGELFVCWSTLFDISDDGDSSRQPAFWTQPTAMILCSGGHFAATIFDRHSVAKSKTFHRYVVRAKQVCDFYLLVAKPHINSIHSGWQAGTARPKKTHQQAMQSSARCFSIQLTFLRCSAGSSLRRHNEMQLQQVHLLPNSADRSKLICSRISGIYLRLGLMSSIAVAGYGCMRPARSTGLLPTVTSCFRILVA